MTSVADPAAESGPEPQAPHVPSPEAPAQPVAHPHAVAQAALQHAYAGPQHPALQAQAGTPAHAGPYPPAGSDPAPYPQYVAPQPDRLTRFVSGLWARSPRWLAPVAALGCMAGAVGYTMWTDPTDASPDAVSTCLLRYTTGFDCPGCGGTRAFWYLLHANLPAAARHHVMFVFALPFLLYIYVAWAGRELFRWRLPQLRLSPRTLGVFLAVWGVWSVLRNLPWATFSWMYV